LLRVVAVVAVRLATAGRRVVVAVAACWPAQRHSKPAFLILCVSALVAVVALRRPMEAILY
jgi:hypothetical protein